MSLFVQQKKIFEKKFTKLLHLNYESVLIVEAVFRSVNYLERQNTKHLKSKRQIG